LGSFARIREYDVAVIDYFLGSMQGDEIAEYVDTFFSEIPVIIVSSRPFNDDEVASWPSSVRRFIAKSHGPGAIVEAARALVNREQLLKRLRVSRTASPTV
jgi:DNA-binding response OmpR family regulator